MSVKIQKLLKIGAVIALSVLFYLYNAHKIDLMSADLGRHIMNGKIIIDSLADGTDGWKGIIYQNTYSYTEPHQPFVNHHWGSGPIFYLLYLYGGFPALSVFYITLCLLAFLIAFFSASRVSNFWTAFCVSLFFLPAASARWEVRPECFTYFFSLVVFWVLWRYRTDSRSHRLLWILPPIMFLWTNLHIYFIVGMVLIVIFLQEQIFLYSLRVATDERNEKIKKLWVIFFASIAATCLNPHGIKGAFYPLLVSKDIGLMSNELRSMSFFPNITTFDINVIIVSLAIAAVAIALVIVRFTKSNVSIALIWLGFFSLIAYIKYNRNITLFGYFFFIIAAYAVQRIISAREKNKEMFRTYFFPVLKAFFIFLMIFFNAYKLFSLNWKDVGIGLSESSKSALDFFHSNDIKGPVFNDYNSSSFVIYTLYPKEKVFDYQVPEAHSPKFFEINYSPVLSDEDLWRGTDKKYDFQTIIFNFKGAFVDRRRNDYNWKKIFENDGLIVFAKNK